MKKKPVSPIDNIININKERNNEYNRYFNPITGEGASKERVKLNIKDFSIGVQYIPKEMLKDTTIKKLKEAGSIEKFLKDYLLISPTEKNKLAIIKKIIEIRCNYDFYFWCSTLAYIKNKGGGDDVHFRPRYAQRKIIDSFEEDRLAGLPIRLIILKARQLGCSTLIQMYFAWLQLIHKRGLNSLIISLQAKASDEIFDMYDRLIKNYPLSMLHKNTDEYPENEPKFVGVGTSGAIHRVPQRNCKIKLGSAEKPDSCRGGDYNLVHLSEVGLWKKTDGKSPKDIVQGACSGIAMKPFTMIVYESTAKGTGNFFHEEYVAAKKGQSQFKSIFIPWFIITDLYSISFKSEKQKIDFAKQIYDNRNNKIANNNRESSGQYIWFLWQQGATLEGINWYINERSSRSSHSSMSSEYPSDDVEAFTDIDNGVFDRYLVEKFRPSCKPAKYIGEVYGKEDEGEKAIIDIKFKQDAKGHFNIWALPDIDKYEIVNNRYLVIVDIGGTSQKSDWSVITVFDRLMMMDGFNPSIVAQWYGHIDMDLLAWKAMQIAAYYDNALLVIESNTLETHDKERTVDGDQSSFILNLIKDVYSNLYARKSSPEDIAEGRPRKYGFHTNVSTKPMVISFLQKVIREQLYTERDERCLHEYLVYEHKSNGAFGAVPGDHDDLLMTRAIGLYICFMEMEIPTITKRIDLTVHHVKRKVVSEATI